MSKATRWLRQLWSRQDTHPLPVELWPDAVEVTARRLECGDGCSATFLVTGYPAEVPLAWLEPLIGTGLHTEVAVHIDPVASETAAARLRRRRARLESSRRHTADHERLDDPYVEAAAADAADLAGRIATGEAKLFGIGVYITVHSSTVEELDEACVRLRAHATAAMIDIRPASWRQLPARFTTLPIGIDALRATRTLDTDTAAASFPFTSPDAPNTAAGVLYGLNISTGAPVIWDRWVQDNHNSVLVARSGAGKSYFTKTEILRQSYDGVAVTVIDPEGEYALVAERAGGVVIRPGQPGVHLNPLDLPGEPAPDALTRRVLFVHTLVATLLGTELSSDEAAVLDDTVLASYEQYGITADASTWDRPVPTLLQVVQALTHGAPDCDVHPTRAGEELAARLRHLVDGGLCDLFTDATTHTDPGTPTVYDLSNLPDELLSAGCLIVLDRIWGSLEGPGRKLVVVDEAWTLLTTGPGATFLARLAKSARKRGAGLMTVTQDAEDIVGTELGRVVIQNSSTQILMRQSPQAMELVTKSFGLTDAEHALLTSARRGEALLRSGETHVAFTAIASDAEHELCLTGLTNDRDVA